MDEPIQTVFERFAWPAYFAGLLLIVTPAVDFVTNIWPLELGALPWRYGTVGLLSGFLHTPLLGVLLLIAAAATLRHRRIQRAVAAVNIVSAVALLLATALFTLDVLQFRGQVEAEALGMYQLGAVKAVFKHLSMVVAFGWLGLVGMRSSRPSKEKQAAPPPLFGTGQA